MGERCEYLEQRKKVISNAPKEADAKRLLINKIHARQATSKGLFVTQEGLKTPKHNVTARLDGEKE